MKDPMLFLINVFTGETYFPANDLKIAFNYAGTAGISTNNVTWEGLPPGEYRLMIAHPIMSQGLITQPPRELGQCPTVTVAQGFEYKPPAEGPVLEQLTEIKDPGGYKDDPSIKIGLPWKD
jgi:hypothetical protein